MVTYKEQIKDKRSFVLLQNSEVLATFGNLKKVCNFMGGKDFPKYNTLVRKKEYPISYKDYSIYKVKHY